MPEYNPHAYRETHIGILCSARTDPPTSHNYWPEMDEWQDWAVGVWRGAVAKAEGVTGIGPLCVASWLSMRAAARGWVDTFEFWGERAHRAGTVDKKLLEGPLFAKASRRLALDERLEIAWNRTHKEYKEVFGYPIGASPLAMESE